MAVGRLAWVFIFPPPALPHFCPPAVILCHAVAVVTSHLPQYLLGRVRADLSPPLHGSSLRDYFFPAQKLPSDLAPFLSPVVAPSSDIATSSDIAPSSALWLLGSGQWLC